MRHALPILALAIGCGSTEPTSAGGLEPGRYILSRFDDQGPPAVVSDITDPNGRYVEGIEFDTVFIETVTRFRRVARTRVVVHLSGQAPDTSRQELSYSGEILQRDDAVILAMDQPPWNIQPIELRPGPGVLLRRIAFQVMTCEGTAPAPCQITRQGMADASYERR